MRAWASGLLQPIERDATDAQAIKRADFAVASAVADEHGVAHEMDGGVVVVTVGIVLNELALRPGLAAVRGDGGDERIALLRRKRKHTGVVIVDGQKVAAAGQALDAGGTVGRFHFRGLRWRERLACIGGAKAVLRALIGAAPGEDGAIRKLHDTRLLQAAAAAHGHGPPA